MAVHNGANEVGASVQSILSQTHRDLELIVIDDGSSDSTLSILEQWAKSDSRVRVVSQANTGLTRALIRGCQLACGEYIARHDADDWSDSRRFERQVELLQSDSRIGFVSCSTQDIGPAGEVLAVTERDKDPLTATNLLLNHRHGPPAHGSVMMRRAAYEQVGGYREQFYFAQDSDLWLRLAESFLFASVPEVLYRTRRDLTGISALRRPDQKRFADLSHATRGARVAGESELPLLAEAAAMCDRIRSSSAGGSAATPSYSIAMAYLIGSQLVKQGDARARVYLWRVIRRQPWHARAWVRMAQSLWQWLSARSTMDANG